MLIIGELINSSRKEVKAAIENYDEAFIIQLAQQQAAAGADYIDINCGTFLEEEYEEMEWLIKTVQKAVETPICIDSPDSEVIKHALEICQCEKPFINSITAESKRFQEILPLVIKYKAKVIALCMDDNGMPTDKDTRIHIAEGLLNDLTNHGIPIEDIYLDPLVKPISTCDTAGKDILETIAAVKALRPKANFICGLSNISYGLPNRKWVNRTFMVQTMVAGMNSYILNPTDQVMMAMLYASDALLGNDSFCGRFISAHRKGLFENI